MGIKNKVYVDRGFEHDEHWLGYERITDIADLPVLFGLPRPLSGMVEARKRRMDTKFQWLEKRATTPGWRLPRAARRHPRRDRVAGRAAARGRISRLISGSAGLRCARR